MKKLLKFRNRVRKIFAKNEVQILRVLKFLVVLIAILFINKDFGYQKFLSNWWVAVALGIVGVFVPFKVCSVMVIVFALMQLASLSTDIALVLVILLIASALLMAYFNSKSAGNVIYEPFLYQLRIPFLAPMITGLQQNESEIVSVIMGCVTTYFLKGVKNSASGFLEDTVAISATDILKNQVFLAPMFYIFLLGSVAMFVIVALIKRMDINNVWSVAVLVGTLVEFAIMLSGAFILGQTGDILWIVLGNLVTLILGFVIAFFTYNANYNRIEKVQFEDDEYYYYVTAVPKVRFTEEDKQVMHITKGKGNRE